MHGEGAGHHMHHAKSDISYAHLQSVQRAVEAKYPHLKLGARRTDDVMALEKGHLLPPKQTVDSPPTMQFHIDRTAEMMEAKDMLGTGPTAAVTKIANAMLKSVLHQCVTSDKGLLRQIHKDMRMAEHKLDKNHPFPCQTWDKTAFAESTSRDLSLNTNLIAEEVRKVAEVVGASMHPMTGDNAFKSSYLDFFVNLADVMVTPDQQFTFGTHFAQKLKIPLSKCDFSREGFLKRLKTHLESPVDSEFIRGKKRTGSGSREETMRMMKNLIFGIYDGQSQGIASRL